jgi:hypothetical protein
LGLEIKHLLILRIGKIRREFCENGKMKIKKSELEIERKQYNLKRNEL